MLASAVTSVRSFSASISGSSPSKITSRDGCVTDERRSPQREDSRIPGSSDVHDGGVDLSRDKIGEGDLLRSVSSMRSILTLRGSILLDILLT